MRFPSVLIVALTIALTTDVYGRPVGSGTNLTSQKVGDWLLTLLRFDDGLVVKAITTDLTGPNAYFSLVYGAKICKSPLIEVVVINKEKYDDDIQIKYLGTAKLRIDEGIIYEGVITDAMANLGENDIHAYIKLSNTSDYSSFLKDLSRGQTLRIKYKTSNDESFSRMSLKGAAEALSRSKKACERMSVKPDSDFFSNEKPYGKSTNQNNDELYF